MPSGIVLLAYSCFAAGLFLIERLDLHLAIAALAACSLLFIPFRRVRSGIVPITLFLVFTFVSNLFYQSGRVLATVGPLLITDEGVRLAAVRTLRVFDLIFAAKVLTTLLPLETMLASLGRFLRPLERLGVPVHEFFLVVTLTLQCFPVLKERLSGLYRERVAGKHAVTFREKLRIMVSFLVPLFIESMRNPESFFVQSEEGKS